jgi:hypothetical protein
LAACSGQPQIPQNLFGTWNRHYAKRSEMFPLNLGALRFQLVLVAAGLTAASALGTEPMHYEPLGAPNGCFVESVACFDLFHELAGPEPWARVLQWGAKEDEEMVAGHAVAVMEFSGRLWSWDINYGWRVLSIASDQRDDAATVAAPVLARYPRTTAVYPILWNDLGQPAGSPPNAPDESESAGLVSRVAERLAKHRPVNLVSFPMPDGQKGYAVVFVFGGRLCFYSPEVGTHLFRGRTTVMNARAIQYMIHRIYPDAGGADAPASSN